MKRKEWRRKGSQFFEKKQSAERPPLFPSPSRGEGWGGGERYALCSLCDGDTGSDLTMKIVLYYS
jgi:hypothetical protein